MFIQSFPINRLVHFLLLIAGIVVSIKTTPLFARQQPAINYQGLNYSTNMDDNATDTATRPINDTVIVPQKIHQIHISGEWLSSSIKLMWKCADKIPVLYYELQRSRDSINFVPILLMHAKNAARNANGYQFTDTAIPSGTCYYRLRIEDMDGSVTYSPVIPYSNQQANSVAKKDETRWMKFTNR